MRTRPSFDDVRAAAARIALAVPPTPVLRSAAIDELGPHPRAPQGRAPPRHRRLQAARRHQRGAAAVRRGGGPRRGRPQLGQPRLGPGGGRGHARHPVHGRDPARHAGRQGRRRRGAGARIVECEPTMASRAETLAQGGGRDGRRGDPPLRRPAGAGRTGHRHPRAARGGAGDRHGRGPGERRRAAVRAPPSPPTASTRRCRCGAPSPSPSTTPTARWPPATSCSTAPATRSPTAWSPSSASSTLAILQAEQVQVVTVTEDEIVEGMRRLATDAKQIVEPSGAVALAGLARLAREGVPLPSDVGVIVSGGNVDLDRWYELVGRPDRLLTPARGSLLGRQPCLDASCSPLAALALAVALGGAGCADDVSPGRPRRRRHREPRRPDGRGRGVGGQRPTLLARRSRCAGTGHELRGSRYSTEFVDDVLTNRVVFELHNAEFERRGLELTDEELERRADGLFGDPTVTAAVLDELGDAVRRAARRPTWPAQFAGSRPMARGRPGRGDLHARRRHRGEPALRHAGTPRAVAVLAARRAAAGARRRPALRALTR